MGRTVAELGATLSDSEMRHWMAFDALEPIGDYGAYFRNASAMAMLANIHRDPKKGKAFEPADFMPKRPNRAVDPKENSKAIRADLFAAFGDRIKHGKI